MTKQSVCIVNKSFPPVASATGFHAQNLANYLIRHTNVEVVVCTQRLEKHKSPPSAAIEIRYSPAYYRGKWKIPRLIENFISSLQLIISAKRSRADHIVVLTDPSFLTFWASFLLPQKRWTMWSMDIYPEAFVAAGLVSEKNLLYKLISRALIRHPPSLVMALGPSQANYLKDRYYPGTSFKHMPVGDHGFAENKEPPATHDRNIVRFGYFGNLGEAHDQEFLVQFAHAIQGGSFHLLVGAYGVKYAAFKNKVCAFENVHFVENNSLDFNYRTDVHLVSLSNAWTHICVPSKAFKALSSGAAVLFFGSHESDTWSYVKSAGWHMESYDQIVPFLNSLKWMDVRDKQQKAVALSRVYKGKYYQSFSELLKHMGVETIR